MAYQPLWGVYNTPPPEYHEESHHKPPAEHVIRLSESSPIESRELSLRVRSDIQRVLAARTAILELNVCTAAAAAAVVPRSPPQTSSPNART